MTPILRTATCRVCGHRLVYRADGFAWRHTAVPLDDHAPRPATDAAGEPIRSAADELVGPLSELELRYANGDR